MKKHFKNKIFFKPLQACVILLCLVCFIASCKTGKQEETTEQKEYNVPIEAKEWAFLLYDDADFNNAFDPLQDFAESAYSNEYVNVMVIQDKEHGPAKIWYIDENHDTKLLKEMGEINMGDYQVLRDFLDYSKSKCSAQRYILSFYNHGSAWEGACNDGTSSNDLLAMDEIQRALADTGGVDIVCFSAPCLMGALESVYELRDLVEVYIGSEEYSGYVWWFDTMGVICDTLKQSPDISNIQLGEQIIQSIEQHSVDWPQYVSDLTMSAVRTDRIVELANAVDALSVDFVAQINESASLVNQVYDNVFSLGSGRYLDVYDFAEKCHGSTSDAGLRTRLERVMETLSNAVFAQCRGSSMENAHGLSIYFPDTSQFEYKTYYGNPQHRLDFSADTSWDEFLTAYFNISGPTATYSVKPFIPDTGGLYPPQR